MPATFGDHVVILYFHLFPPPPLRASQVEQQAFELLPTDYIRKHAVIPLRFAGSALVVGMTDPNNIFRDLYTKTCRAAMGTP